MLAATPIGDVADASPRLVAELTNADVIAAEDTRRLRRLLERLGRRDRRADHVLLRGKRGAAHRRTGTRARGTELESSSSATQGCRRCPTRAIALSTAAVAGGFRVTAVPGPSAVLTALAVSGLPVDRFCFEGFLPRKAAERARRLGQLAAEPRTMVFFEAPHRAAATLSAMAVAFGADRPGCGLPRAHQDLRGNPPRVAAGACRLGGI